MVRSFLMVIYFIFVLGVYEELEIEDFIPQLAGVITTSIDDEKDELGGNRSNNHSPYPEERPRNLSNDKPAPISAKLSRFVNL